MVPQKPSLNQTVSGVTGAALQNRVPVPQGGFNLVQNGVSGCSC